MSVPWAEDFGVYRAWMQDKPVFVTVDLGACAYPPASTHPMLLRVRVALQHPTESGLYTSEEGVALASLEDAVTARLQESADAWLVGRYYSNGEGVYAYYALEEPRSAIDARRGWEPYRLQLSAGRDSDWGYLRDFLAPNDFQQILIATLRSLHSLQVNGDEHHLPRTVDHLALFADPSSAADAAAALRQEGFTVDPPRSGNDRFEVAFRRVDTLEDCMERLLWGVYETVTRHAGTYGGWGAPVTPPPL
jgi:hypothetical protein